MQNLTSINLDTKKTAKMIFIFFITIEITFLFLDFIINYNHFIDYGPIRRLFNIAREDSFSSWFMSAQTLLSGMVLLGIYLIKKKINSKANFQVLGWFILASFFIYMAADDAALIHERLGSTFELISKESTNDIYLNFPSYAWQVVVLPFFIGMGIFILIFLWKVFKKEHLFINIVFAFLMFTIAVVLDFFEGVDKDSPLYIYNSIQVFLNVELFSVEHYSKAIEELFEMIGMTIFLVTFIEYIGKIKEGNIVIQIK